MAYRFSQAINPSTGPLFSRRQICSRDTGELTEYIPVSHSMGDFLAFGKAPHPSKKLDDLPSYTYLYVYRC